MTLSAGEEFDVVVVGAGPAGSAAARNLATAGVRVLLVDACGFPRSKPCGEAVSPGATPLLDEMGVLSRLRESGATEVRRWRLHTPDGRYVSAAFGPPRDGIPDTGMALSRRRLDAVLLDAALAAGAEFRAPLRVFDVQGRAGDPDAGGPSAAGAVGADGAGADRVRLLARDGNGHVTRLRARWVIGADGLRSVIARRVMGIRHGSRDRLAVVGRYRPETAARMMGPRRARRGAPAPDGHGPGPHAGVGELRLSRDGCLGAAPIEHGLWTVTIVVSRGRAPELPPDPFAFYRAGIDAHGFPPPPSERALAGSLEVTGPFEVAPRAVTAPGIVLAGDAAGYFDPFTGQGIYRALVTGRHAATAVLAALTDPHDAENACRAYAAALADCLAAGRRVQRLIDAVIRRPLLMNGAGRLMAWHPGLLSLLLDVTGDRLPPGRLLRPSVLAASWRG